MSEKDNATDDGETDSEEEPFTCPVCQRERDPEYGHQYTTDPDGNVLCGCVICIDYYEEFGEFPPFTRDE